MIICDCHRDMNHETKDRIVLQEKNYERAKSIVIQEDFIFDFPGGPSDFCCILSHSHHPPWALPRHHLQGWTGLFLRLAHGRPLSHYPIQTLTIKIPQHGNILTITPPCTSEYIQHKYHSHNNSDPVKKTKSHQKKTQPYVKKTSSITTITSFTISLTKNICPDPI